MTDAAEVSNSVPVKPNYFTRLALPLVIAGVATGCVDSSSFPMDRVEAVNLRCEKHGGVQVVSDGYVTCKDGTAHSSALYKQKDGTYQNWDGSKADV